MNKKILFGSLLSVFLISMMPVMSSVQVQMIEDTSKEQIQLFKNLSNKYIIGFLKNILSKMQYLFNKSSRVEKSTNIDNFEEYWQWYSKGKKIWAGNFVDKDGEFIPTPLLVLNWLKGENFSDWYYQASDFIWGIKDVTEYAQFRIINYFIFLVSAGFFLISVIGYIIGLFNYTGGFYVGGLFGIVGSLFTFILLYWDWYIMLYFLFGVNAFMMLFEWGHINHVVEVIGDPEALNNTKVTAYSLNAENKYNENGGIFEGTDVSWHLSEFEYHLYPIEETSNVSNKNYFAINYPEYQYDDKDEDTSHKQWEKAVPPPGD